MRNRDLLVASFLAALVCSGCGPADPLGRRAVTGTVTFDGQPLENGSISLEPIEGATTSAGAVISQGKYSISSEQGLPPGKYRVVINAVKPGTGMTLPPGKFPGEEIGTPPVELIPPDWNTKSKQQIEVRADAPAEFKHEITSTSTKKS